jgi:hypothetical protein
VFPRDPYLPGLASFVGPGAADMDGTADVDVFLPYVPRRRLTFRGQAAAGALAIRKFVRPAEVAAMYDRLAKVMRFITVF